MELKIQIPDSTYRRMVDRRCRVQGSIGLVTPEEGNFNEHVRRDAESAGSKYVRLRHGRVSVNDKRVRLTLHVSLDESGVIPSEAIEDESREASGFVDDVLDTIERYH
ncbi:hypothetical protein [Parabacteroides sp.]